MKNTKRIILNSIRCPDGTILISHSVHDYKEHKDRNNLVYMVDGGHDYLRRNTHNHAPYEELSIYDDAPFEIIRDNYYRGTWDKEGNRIWIKMSEMTDSHLKNCIIYNIDRGLEANCFSNELYQKEIEYRKKNKITIQDTIQEGIQDDKN